ncbi:MFS transporter [Vibrio penaeicida]|uniref:MFS transporter n=1 Tax=Vibrio penaeicida TaxID=104609 RepID=UPI001CC5D223|nr:MFS transporter [Vibrio penaeicida]
MFKRYFNLGPVVYSIALARFISACGAFVPPMLIIILHDKLGISSELIGYIVAAYAIVAMLGSIVSGFLCDRFKTGIIVICSMCVTTTGYLLSAAVSESVYVILTLGLSQLGIGLTYTSTLTLSLKLSKPINRANIVSLNYLCFNLGSAIGPAIAGYLYLEKYEMLYIGSGIAIFVAAITLFTSLYINDALSPIYRNESYKNDQVDVAKEGTLSRYDIIIYSTICFLICFTFATLMFTLPITMNVLFAKKGALYFGYLMSLNALCVIMLTPIIVHFSRNISYGSMLLLSPVFYFVSLAVIFLDDSVFLVFIISTVLWSIGEIVYLTYSELFLTDYASEENIGKISSIPTICYQLASVASPLISGYLINFGSSDAPLKISMVFSVLALINLSGFILKKKRIKLGLKCNKGI